MTVLKVGDLAPDFILPDQDGRSWQLKKHIGQDNVLLAFYPGDFTGVCTQEMICFRDDFSDFQGLDCQLVGISTDDAESHKKFKEQYKLPFPLLTDADAEVSALYGTKLPLVKKSNRSIFIINKKGRFSYVHREFLPVFKRGNEELIAALKVAG